MLLEIKALDAFASELVVPDVGWVLGLMHDGSLSLQLGALANVEQWRITRKVEKDKNQWVIAGVIEC